MRNGGLFHRFKVQVFTGLSRVEILALARNREEALGVFKKNAWRVTGADISKGIFKMSIVSIIDEGTPRKEDCKIAEPRLVSFSESEIRKNDLDLYWKELRRRRKK